MVIRPVLASIMALAFGLVAPASAAPTSVAPAVTSEARTAVATTAVAPVPASFTFNGSGWGHGLGMSQYGAYGQALDGRTANQILEHYYAPATVTQSTSNPELRVQVLATSSDVTVSLVQGSWELVYGPDASLYTLPLTATSVTFTYTPDGRVATTIGGRTYRTSASMPQLFLQWSGTRYMSGSAGLVRVPGANAGTGSVVYRYGRLVLEPYSGKVDVLTDVLLNTEYLYGIAEMPSSWPSEALKAQAIAARTYALRAYDAGLKSYGGHLTDETTSQKYTAWNKQNETTYGVRWVAAVDATGSATSGSVVTYHGSLVQTYYSSSTGGRTINSEDVWGGGTYPYLRSQDDHWSIAPAVHNPYASWTSTLTQAQVAALFHLPDVLTLRVATRTSSGAVSQVVATSSSGATSNLLSRATTDGVRTTLGLKSAFFTIGSKSTVTRLGGPDRTSTAIAISTKAFPDSDEVVLVSGDQRSIVDGLVAGPFARQRSAAVLLTDATALPSTTKAEIVRRAPSKAWVIGGTGVIGQPVVDELQAMGITVERLGGASRFATAAAVAAKMGAADTVVVASGVQANLVDAVAAAGPAAATGEPILLSSPDTLPDATAQAITAAGATHVVMVGGTGAIGQPVVDALTHLGADVTRLGGSDRYATSAAIATAYESQVGSDHGCGRGRRGRPPHRRPGRWRARRADAPDGPALGPAGDRLVVRYA